MGAGLWDVVGDSGKGKERVMYEKGRKKGTVRFTAKPEGGVKKVALAGDFTDWRTVAMRKQKDGTFVAIVPVSAGTWEYRFIFDEQWRPDPDNNRWAKNPYGSFNSVLTVE